MGHAGLELGVFAFIHVKGMHITSDSIAKRIQFQPVPGPLTGNILLEVQLASKVDKGFIHTNSLVWDIHFRKSLGIFFVRGCILYNLLWLA